MSNAANGSRRTNVVGVRIASEWSGDLGEVARPRRQRGARTSSDGSQQLQGRASAPVAADRDTGVQPASPDEVASTEALIARIRVLEKHRNTWRRIAFRLYDVAKQEGAQLALLEAVFDGIDAEDIDRSEGVCTCTCPNCKDGIHCTAQLANKKRGPGICSWRSIKIHVPPLRVTAPSEEKP